jgi:hypothetical protein
MPSYQKNIDVRSADISTIIRQEHFLATKTVFIFIVLL